MMNERGGRRRRPQQPSAVFMLVQKRRAAGEECECAVCGKLSTYHYYGAPCCEACKQFFRRCVIQMKFYQCPRANKCNIRKVHCHGCRLNKCLMAGLEPSCVKIPHREKEEEEEEEENKCLVVDKFLERLDKRAMELMGQQHQHSMLNPISFKQEIYESAFLNLMADLEGRFKKLWDCSRPLAPAYVNRHQNIGELLGVPENLLAARQHFQNEPAAAGHRWDQEKLIAQIERNGIFCSDIKHFVIKDWFMCVALAKAMPFFKQLNVNDQVCLLQHAISPVISLCYAYYSHKISAKTFTRANGYSQICVLRAKNIVGDKILHSMCVKLFCEPLERLGQTGVEYDEFLLLLAILFSTSSDANNLSATGRDLLYAESLRNTKALQKLLAAKHGHFGGARKFASLMHLLPIFHQGRTLLANFVLYLEVFHEKRDPRELFPKAFISCSTSSSYSPAAMY